MEIAVYLTNITKDQYDLIVAEAKKSKLDYDGGIDVNGLYDLTIIAEDMNTLF